MADSSQDITYFARTDYRGVGAKFGIRRDDRRRHMYIIGKTGMGKSVLIENLVYSDIINGHGVALLDPHGDSVEMIIKSIPPERVNDVVYLNPADLEFPVAFNVLEKVEPKYRHLVASGIVGVFKKLWAESWGPRLEYLLRNAILALLDYPDSTLLGVNRLFIDKDYRKKVIAKVQDPVVKTFWEDEFTKYNQSFMVEAIAPIQNKVGQFLSTSLVRNLVGQVKSTINMRKIMDEGKILLVNLSKGRIGEDSSAMIGNMIVTKIQLAAMSRVDTPEDERRDFYLYVDEFQNFATESFANILSEARKYRLNLIVGHQYVEQLDETVSSAIFGNVGTYVVFRVGAADAEVLVKEFEPFFLEEDLVNLPKFHVYLKLMINGVSSDPFSAGTLPPIAVETGTEETVIAVSRERYGRPRAIVEDKIARWSGVTTDVTIEKAEQQQHEKKMKKIVNKDIDFLASLHGYLHDEGETKPASEGGMAEEPEKEEFFVDCNSCGEKTKITFKPDGVRPVYCKDCLSEYRRQQSTAENMSSNISTVKEELSQTKGDDDEDERPSKWPKKKKWIDYDRARKVQQSLNKPVTPAPAPPVVPKPVSPTSPPTQSPSSQPSPSHPTRDAQSSPRPTYNSTPRPTASPAPRPATNSTPRSASTSTASSPAPSRPTQSSRPQPLPQTRPVSISAPRSASTTTPSSTSRPTQNKRPQARPEPKPVSQGKPIVKKVPDEISLTAALSQGVQSFSGKKKRDVKLDEDIFSNYQSLISGDDSDDDEAVAAGLSVVE